MNKIVLGLSGVVALRFFGLFIVLPMLSLYALSKSGANSISVGLIMGGYALTQMIFMYPFGALSDKFSRKKVVIVGLLIFIAGSIMCAMATDATMLLIGRLLQGAGSIGSVVTAMISDFTSEEKRGHAMAIMGGSIAIAFMGAMMIGPIAGAAYGVDTLFWITAGLALGAILFLLFVIPETPKIHHEYEEETKGWRVVLADPNLQKMNGMVFLHAAFMTIIFMVVPLELVEKFHWAKSDLWMVYLPSVIAGVVAMGPAAVFGEKYNKTKTIFLLSIALFGLAFLLLSEAHDATLIIAGTILFFIGFNMQEPLLQSSASKFAKVHLKGTALGVFNTFQSFGAFVGGVAGGYVLHHFDLSVLGTALAVIALVWFWWTLGIANPTKKSFLYLPLDTIDTTKTSELKTTDGVIEYYTNMSERLFIIKYDENIISDHDIRKIVS